MFIFPETDWLAYRVIASPAHPALVWRECIWTFAELNTAVHTLAGQLYAAGLREGQRAAALLPNNPNFVMLIHALIRLGVTLVPLNLRLTTDELDWQIAHTSCDWLLHDDSTDAQAAPLHSPRRLSLVPGNLPIAESVPTRILNRDAPLAIIHTSGTTGHPKGAIQTLGNHFYSAIASAFRLGTLPDDRWLLTIPLYHVGGLAIPLRCCLYGTTVVLPSNEKFDAKSLLDDLETYNVTMVSLVPTMLQRIIEHLSMSQPISRKHGYRGLRVILLGGAAAPPGLLEKTHSLNLPVAHTYGLTESASQVATATPELARAKPGCAGPPLMFTSIRIENEHGQALPPGEVGEIVVCGPTVMRGYDSNPTATAKSLRNGSLHTGDLGTLDTDGNLWVLTRRVDLIVSGGENVYPAEVERTLLEHPSVCEACVVGVDDPAWGQRVAAAVVLQLGAQISTDELQIFCRRHLAGYKLPHDIRIVDTLPQTASGKIQREEVKKLFNT